MWLYENSNDSIIMSIDTIHHTTECTFDENMEYLNLLYLNAYRSNTELEHTYAMIKVFKFLEIFQPWNTNAIHRAGVQDLMDSLLDHIPVDLERNQQGDHNQEKEDALLELESIINDVDNIMNM